MKTTSTTSSEDYNTLRVLRKEGCRRHILQEGFQQSQRQRVFVDGYTSVRSEMKSRVPHGAVSGSVLILAYIRDIEAEIDSVASCFADDIRVMS